MIDDNIIGTYKEYTFHQMKWKELLSLYQTHQAKVFSDTLDFFPASIWSEDEQTAVKQLSDRIGEIYRLNIGIYQEDEFVGWSFGWQENAYRYYMTSTGILPEHQNKGIYTALLPIILENLQEVGFQEIYSRHSVTHNQVIVPKLKAGFIITGLQLSDMFGTLVHLSYFTNPTRRKMLDFRAGQLRPDDEIKGLLRL